MCIRLITTVYTTIVWFIRCMDMRMFFTIWWICKASVTSFMFAFEWFFAWKFEKIKRLINIEWQNSTNKKTTENVWTQFKEFPSMSLVEKSIRNYSITHWRWTRVTICWTHKINESLLYSIRINNWLQSIENSLLEMWTNILENNRKNSLSIFKLVIVTSMWW